MRKFLLGVVLFLLFVPAFLISLNRLSVARHLVMSMTKHAARKANDTEPIASSENPPDVLSATNLEQWKSLIKDLRPTPGLSDSWTTSRFRRGTPPVLLKQDGQSIVYRTEAIEVTVLPKTTDFMEAQLYSPKMNVEEARALGASLCGMFNFDANKLSTWCDTVGTNWLDMPVFNIGDHRHAFNIRHSFSNEKPWFIIFTIEDKNALAKLLGVPSRRTN